MSLGSFAEQRNIRQHSFLKVPLSYFKDPRFGTLDKILMDVFDSGEIMWFANDPRCFEMELQKDSEGIGY